MNKALIGVGGGIAAVGVLALGFGLLNADAGPVDSASADTLPPSITLDSAVVKGDMLEVCATAYNIVLTDGIEMGNMEFMTSGGIQVYLFEPYGDPISHCEDFALVTLRKAGTDTVQVGIPVSSTEWVYSPSVDVVITDEQMAAALANDGPK